MKSKRDGRESVPTLHKPDLYKWRNQYDWDTWVAQKHEEELAIDNAKLRNKRERALNQLTLLGDDTIAELGRMIRDPMTPANVKARLFETVLTRIVLDVKEDSRGHNEFNDVPSVDASAEEKMRWLSKAL